MVREESLLGKLVNHALLGVTLIGAIYLIVYMWPLWPVTMRLLASGVGVGTMYLFLGGYAWWRALEARRQGHAHAIRPMSLVLILTAAWDVASPFVLGDLHPISITGHVVGGTLALALSLLTAWGHPEEPARRRRPSAQAP